MRAFCHSVMSRVSGIGENKLREFMDSAEIEYIQNGNRRLIADSAIKKKPEPLAVTGFWAESDIEFVFLPLTAPLL